MHVGVVTVAAAVGLLLGPLLSAWVDRAAPPHGGSPVRRSVVIGLLTSALFALCAYRYGGSATLPAWCWLSATGIVLALVDVRQRRLPFRMTAAMTAGGVVALAVAAAVEDRWTDFAAALIAGLAGLVIAGAVQLAVPAHTGGGDTALAGALVFYLGWLGWAGLVQGLLLATGLTAVVGAAVFVARRCWTASFPAGPSLIAGTIAGVLLA
ncbi:prepilin peptidase [Prauserella oleivorans]|uniref:Prepilin peptidase n=1 Tax=Prauserella oleivorans TaxID=1478153 RepID=A0ABW5WIG6_9PSEU